MSNNKEQIAHIEQAETDALNDAIVYCWVHKSTTGHYFIGSAYATREKAEDYPPSRQKGTEYALVRLDLTDINFLEKL